MRRGCDFRTRVAWGGCGWSPRSRPPSDAASPCCAPPAATPYPEGPVVASFEDRPSFAVDERLYVGLEGDLDLVAPDFLHEPDAEGWVLDHFLGRVCFLRRVLAGAGQVLACEERLPAGDGRLRLAPLADLAGFPGALPRGRAGGAPGVVLAILWRVVDSHRPRLKRFRD